MLRLFIKRRNCRNIKISLRLLMFKSHLCDFFKVLMPLLQSSGSMQRLANTCVFAEEGLPVVFYPVQHLYTHTHSERTLIKQRADAILTLTTKGCI